MAHLTESEIESATLSWLAGLGYQTLFGPDIAPGEPAAKREHYGQVVLERRLRDALLPKLIFGQIRVKDAERFLKERGL